MGQQLEPPVLQLVVAGLHAAVIGRYSLTVAYVVCFYDWVISLDREVDLIYPSPWNVVKAAYLFCRYYPLAIAPFHLWGFLVDHEQRVCETYYHALFACTIPTVVSAQFILMLRTYAFSGRKTMILGVLSVSFFCLVGIMIWVMGTTLHLSLLFNVVKRSVCFATSDQPPPGAAPATSAAPGDRPPLPYHVGMVSILLASFDGLNMLIMVCRCIRERGNLGPLGQSFLKQGILVYVVSTTLNMLSVGTFFSSPITPGVQVFGPLVTYVLPSPLSCGLVLMLRRKASPTQSELHIDYSHMVNEALEMIPVECQPGDIPKGLTAFISIDAQAQP